MMYADRDRKKVASIWGGSIDMKLNNGTLLISDRTQLNLSKPTQPPVHPGLRICPILLKNTDFSEVLDGQSKMVSIQCKVPIRRRSPFLEAAGQASYHLLKGAIPDNKRCLGKKIHKKWLNRLKRFVCWLRLSVAALEVYAYEVQTSPANLLVNT
jgi:hypothetical protein